MIPTLQDFISYGPWAVVLMVAIAYYRKDKELSTVNKAWQKQRDQTSSELLDVIRDNTTADIKLESAINGLRDVMMTVVGKLK